MTTNLENDVKEPIHLLVLRGLVFTAALATGLWSVANPPVLAAVLAAALLGLVASRELARTKVRAWVVLAASAMLAGLGWAISAFLGDAAWFSHLIGVGAALATTQAIQLSLATLGLTLSMRMLSLRLRLAALLEAALAAAIVIALFAGHRDYQIAQPRFLADWAFSTGRDPAPCC